MRTVTFLFLEVFAGLRPTKRQRFPARMRSKRSKNNWLFAGLLLVVPFGRPLRGAESITLHLRNGDRITGTISSEDTNRVVLSTPWIKEVIVLAAQISKREPARHAETPPGPAAGAGATAGTTSPELKIKPSRLLAGEVNLGTDLGFSEKNRQLYTARSKI